MMDKLSIITPDIKSERHGSFENDISKRRSRVTSGIGTKKKLVNAMHGSKFCAILPKADDVST